VIFDHIGLFVADLDQGRRKLAALLPIVAFSDAVEDAGLKVRIQFATDASGVRYELVAPFGEGDPVSGVLASGQAILNHVAYRVADLDADMALYRWARRRPPSPSTAGAWCSF